MDLSEVSILELLPPNLARDPNVKAMAQAFDMALREIIVKIPEIEIIPNLVGKKIVDDILLDLLAWQFHADFYDPGLPIEAKQELVLKALDWHFRKGTPSVVEEIVTALFSDAEIKEWFQYEGLPYHFRISTGEPLPDQETFEKFLRAVRSVKNTRSFLDSVDVIRQFYAEVFGGVFPRVDGLHHLLAKEHEATAYVAARPAFHFDLPAKEDDAQVNFVVLPNLDCVINILTDTDAHSYTSIVPGLNSHLDILADDNPQAYLAALTALDCEINVLSEEDI